VITAASVDQQLESELASEPVAERPSPPSFEACADHLRQTQKEAGASEASISTVALVKQCRERYEKLRASVVEQLISIAWVIEGARELGVDVTSAQARRLGVKQLTPNVRANIDAEAIRRKLRQSVKPMSWADAAGYYATHHSKYVIPEERDLAIVRTGTRQAGAVVRAELAAGADVAKIAKHFPIRQPFYSKNGVVKGLKPGVYREPRLDHAIFTAPIGKALGPIDTVIGFYVFEVRAIRRGRQQPLAEVGAKIKREVPELRRQQALARFISTWREKWTSRTHCRQGYIVRKCAESPLSHEVKFGSKYALE
jgi:hypothetical protein